MKIRIIGAVAAGTSAGAKARRNRDDADILIYEKGSHISYSGCGLPYYIGDAIEDIEELTPRDPAFFRKKYNIDIKTRHEVLDIDLENKSLLVRDLDKDITYKDTYDKLVIATGAKPRKLPIEGIDSEHVFHLRDVKDAKAIKGFIATQKPKHAVIIGSGFIGMEMLENLTEENIQVTMVEREDFIAPSLDEDMSLYLESALRKKAIHIVKGRTVTAIEPHRVVLDHDMEVYTDMVIIAAGVEPCVELAEKAGIELGSTGAIKVDDEMKTSAEDVYACGDCIQTYSLLTYNPVYHPLGSTANKTGRIAGDALTGGPLRYKGNLGTGIYKLFDLTVARTGLSEKEAMEAGYSIEICHNIKPDKPAYMKGQMMTIKAIADKNTGRLLGAQIIGGKGVDKRIDVLATLITYKAKAEELFHLDLAYAPPFSTTKDPVHYTGMILENAIHQNRPLITSKELREKDRDKIQIVDARVSKQYDKAHVNGAKNMPHSVLREELKHLDKEKTTVTYCNKGVTGNAAQNILLGNGFKEVYNLSGGNTYYQGTK